MNAYYNEHDRHAAAWLRELIREQHIAPGDVDERSIVDVSADDLRGYTQCHFFAGIGGWSHALRLAGWADDRPVWTGSCPCQPFSAAGKGQGKADERHLWPAFFRLIRECRPPVIFGEQVAAAVDFGWLDSPGPNLQALRDREAVFGVLREFQGQSGQVQGVHAGARTGAQARRSRGGEYAIQAMAGHEARLCACECGEVSGEGEGLGVRSGCSGHSAPDQCRLLRVNRDRLRSDIAAILECSFAGSDRLEAGIHAGQYAGSSLFAERDGEYVGRGEDHPHCVGDFESAQSAQRALDDLVNGALEGADRPRRQSSVCDDLEHEGYAVGPVVLPACSVGAFHIRSRLWFVGVADSRGWQTRVTAAASLGHGDSALTAGGGSMRGMADAERPAGRANVEFRADHQHEKQERPQGAGGLGERSAVGIVADSECGTAERRGHDLADAPIGTQREARKRKRLWDDARAGGESGVAQGDANEQGSQGRQLHDERTGKLIARPASLDFWADAKWIACTDGKARPVKPGVFPLADGLPGRVGLLRGAGNAIVPQAAAEVIAAYMEIA